jgi:phage terminase large subunit-like protein
MPLLLDDEEAVTAVKANEPYRLVISDDVLTNPLTDEEQSEFADLTARFLAIPYCPWTPNAGPQSLFLLDWSKEALYGGAAGGGKSIAILMAASQFLHVPGYNALILRKSFGDLEKPGALLDIASQWWGPQLGNGVKFNAMKHQYVFDCPDGGKSSITFGYLDNENDRFNYQGGAYHFIGFDELTQFKERDYRYLFSRMRRIIDPDNPLSIIPIRMRSTTNPGGTGHEWVYKRFIKRWEEWRKGLARQPKRNFHPAVLDDNPQLDKEDYMESLEELDIVTRAQLLRGDWNIRPDGRMFSRGKFVPVTREEVPDTKMRWVRFWDMAGTAPDPGMDPDFTVGMLVGKHTPTGRYYIADMRRWRKNPDGNDTGMQLTALHDTRMVLEAVEQEPGSSGKTAIFYYNRGPFKDSRLKAVPASGKSRGRTTTVVSAAKTPPAKILAAGPASSRVDAGLVYFVEDGSYDTESMLSEIELFPDGEHDDVVDTFSGAVNLLDKMPRTDLKFDTNTETDMLQVNAWRPEAMSNSPLVDDLPPERGGVGRKSSLTHDQAVAEAQVHGPELAHQDRMQISERMSGVYSM